MSTVGEQASEQPAADQPAADQPTTDQPMAEQPAEEQPSFGRWMGSMWLYTGLRFGLFAVLWAVLFLVGVRGLLAPLIALVLSVPLSFILLAKPRAAFTHQLELRVEARRVDRGKLDAELDPNAEE